MHLAHAVPAEHKATVLALQVLQFRTDQERDIKRVDELTGFFLAAMSSSDPAQHEAEGKSGAEAAAAGGQRRAKRRN